MSLRLFNYGFITIILSQMVFINTSHAQSSSSSCYGENLANECSRQFDQQKRGKVTIKFTDGFFAGLNTRTYGNEGGLAYSAQPGKGVLSGNFNAGTSSAKVAKGVAENIVGGNKATNMPGRGATYDTINYKNGDTKTITYTDNKKTTVLETEYTINDGKGGQIKVVVDNYGQVSITTTKGPLDPAFVAKVVDEITGKAGYDIELRTFAGPFNKNGSTNNLTDRTLSDDKSFAAKASEKAKSPPKDPKSPL
ncbi:MAG: hypothetical protein K1X44_07110 [Alphaproteobacteria bacterium]|nr:hypothetical protein [Alphaproteobacteria bacterium]